MRVQPSPTKSSNSINATTALLIFVVVGIISFAAGASAQKYGLINEAAPSNETVASQDLPEDLDYSEVEKLYDTLRKKYDGELTEAELVDGLKKGLTKATGDPYTTYLNSDEAKAFTDDLNGKFSGIGAEIGLENEVITVIAPLKGFPAEKAGLRAGDSIIKIDDEETFGMTVEDAVLKIRGEVGTDVVLTIFRNSEQQEITITREEIQVPSVEWEIRDGVGIMTLSRFAEDTVRLANQAADEFIAAGVKGVVLDLRNNSGGFLEASVDVSSIWIDGKVVVEQRENQGSIITASESADSGAKLGDMPTVVLINKGSASASEIVAGALNDYEKAELIGQTTYGKGSVQALDTLSDGGVLKVTIARWYTPNGSNIDKDGIAPDVEVEVTEEDYEADRDPQLNKALEIISQ